MRYEKHLVGPAGVVAEDPSESVLHVDIDLARVEGKVGGNVVFGVHRLSPMG
jgi:hypothetical protein